ncbi:dynein heavy chain 2, axonemal-like [Sparus aurata]|uniref:dynein heavy chain 2, axonemal-like n=1 Tax=Sparus aurata TaxID=8175 RepID=UPI0011C13EC9|nr:dynein heavy chain 2, axonemal-like [Sparus aurata]
MLIVRSLRQDRVSVCITSLVVNNLGPHFVEPSVLDIKAGLKVIDFQMPDYLQARESAIQFGSPVLLQNILEELEPSLNPLSNPHYTPEISTKTNIVNFTIKEQGLEAQLLGIVVCKERPELEAQMDSLVISIASGKKSLQELEDEILRLLSDTTGSLLDDVQLVDTLQTSKVTATEVSEQLKSSEQTKIKLDSAIEDNHCQNSRDSTDINSLTCWPTLTCRETSGRQTAADFLLLPAATSGFFFSFIQSTVQRDPMTQGYATYV